MLIIPMTGKISWRNPPFITILLILVNCLVYFGIQHADAEKQRGAAVFYVESGLAEMEIDRFIEYMSSANRQEEISLPEGVKRNDPLAVACLHRKMVSDREFMRRLQNDEIITVNDPLYPKWKDLRNKHRQMLSKITAERYGYKPAAGTLQSAFTYMFLHGSAMHLIGNMIFLWLVGCTLELAGRRSAYALIYLATGLISAIAFGLVYRDSTIPLVGASGAIAGIIGAYTVLFGKKKIKVFYSLGFYFNYARVSAIFLLPVWIGNEVFQLFYGGASNVAYMAHIGGLVSGAALGLVQSKTLGGVKEAALPEDRAERIASLMESGLQKFSELDLKGARELISRVLEMEPDNRAALTHLFNIDKLNPEHEQFHDTAARLLLCLQREVNGHPVLFTTYQEYCRIAKQPKLSPDLWSRLSLSFSQDGHIEDSTRIVSLLLHHFPKSPGAPTALLNLSRAYLDAGMDGKGKKCLQLLCQRYPDSTESRIAQEMMEAIA